MSDSAVADTPSPLPDAKSGSRIDSRPSFARRRRVVWLDLVVVVALFIAALPLRWRYTRGDFWLDEADYAAAAVRGFDANRWDRPDSAADPGKTVRLRHFHPPLVSHLMALAMLRGRDDRILRIPSVIAGGLTVSLLYLCGLSLFSQLGFRARPIRGPTLSRAFATRIIAIACALVLIGTPAHIRASSHALPWSLITLWLVALLWTLLRLSETARPGWLAAACLFLGLLFATSEYAVPATMAVLLALPFAAWPQVRDRRHWTPLALSLIVGAVLFLAAASALWPEGLEGGMAKMLGHYAAMRFDPWPVRIRGIRYERAPKTAYVMWYWDLFKPFFLYYALGAAGALAFLFGRRGRRALCATLAFTSVILTVAHVSHIIGPEYLVHALPLLTLLGGVFFVLLAEVNWLIGCLLALAAAGLVGSRFDASLLAGMDARSIQPRWPAAARFIASKWRPGDRMLAPSYGGPGRWYVLYARGVDAKDWQIQGLPAPGERVSDRLISDLRRGVYRFVAVGSTFADSAGLDSRLTSELAEWKPVWQSEEGGTGPSRLIIYERKER
jgi:4-amino-4-deoxy-L-arabinose transferase-like glycosyltransferase